MITVTKEELRQRFKQYNKDYFNNSLGNCEFHFLNKNISILGKYNEKKIHEEKYHKYGLVEISYGQMSCLKTS